MKRLTLKASIAFAISGFQQTYKEEGNQGVLMKKIEQMALVPQSTLREG
jgi:hypothetical protein